MPSDDQRAMSLERLVGFVDLVGYTRLSTTLSHGDLPELLSRFEATVGRAVAAAGGRIVKTIGDEVMFVVPDPASGSRAAVDMLLALHAEGLPEARVGIAFGPVVGYEGDYFGDVVNLAARLVALADPMSVLAPASLAAAADSADLVVTPVDAVAAKGFAAPVDVVRIAAS
jgi:adenylate cyclase